jgi:hypothetical protein
MADRLSVRAVDAAGQDLIDWQGTLEGDRWIGVSERPDKGLAEVLLQSTDGILAGFVWWRRHLLTVDNL